MIKSVFFSIVVSLAIGAAAQQGTPPDPRAGQSPTAPQGAPTDTPQAQQNESPAAKPTQTPQGNANTAPAQVPPPAPQVSTQPTEQKQNQQQTNGEQSSKPGQNSSEPKSEPQQTTASVELSPPVTGNPETKIIDPSAIGKHTGVTGATDPLLDTQPLPKGKPTLIGGTAVKVDRVRSCIVVEPFGAKQKIPIMIDERSHIYRNGIETTLEHVKKGDRVYFDTMLDGPRVFAKNVRVISETGAAEVRGQITAYDARRGVIQLHDALSARPVEFRINSSTRVTAQQGSASIGDLARGALVDVMFAPDKANRGIATEVVLLARPGVSYTFAGTITNVNVRDGVVSVENQADGKIYDIEFDPRSKNERVGLHVGNDVNIAATFDGENYRATNVTVNQATKAAPKALQQKKSDDRE